MKNIIRAQLYKFRKQRLVHIIFFGIASALMINAFFGFGDGETPSGSKLATGLLQFQSTTSILYVIFQTGVFCCSDFLDKTANYEILSGHTRKEVYLGRIIPCMITGIIGWFFIICTPYLLCTALSGWGTYLTFSEVALRVFLMLFPVARIICEFIMLSFIVRNQYVIMGVGYMVFMIGGISPVFSESGSVFLGITNLTLLSTFDVWGTYGLNGDMNYIQESAITASEITATILSSVIFGIASLLIGYRFFRTDDVN